MWVIKKEPVKRQQSIVGESYVFLAIEWKQDHLFFAIAINILLCVFVCVCLCTWWWCLPLFFQQFFLAKLYFLTPLSSPCCENRPAGRPAPPWLLQAHFLPHPVLHMTFSLQSHPFSTLTLTALTSSIEGVCWARPKQASFGYQHFLKKPGSFWLKRSSPSWPPFSLPASLPSTHTSCESLLNLWCSCHPCSRHQRQELCHSGKVMRRQSRPSL